MFLVIDLIHSHHKMNKNLKINNNTNIATNKMKTINIAYFSNPPQNTKPYLISSITNSQ
jgi:hypothetical protein